jgi:penicillin-binding protein 1A
MQVRRTIVGGTVLVVAIALFSGAWQAAVFTRAVAAELAEATELAQLQPRPQSTIVFDRHGKPAFSFFVEQRIDVPLDRVSPRMIDALLAIEDRRFFSHHGLDPIRIAGAAWRNVQAGRIVEGGSTLTQQLVRVAQLSPRRTFERKLREATIAAHLEQRYSKQEILEAYLNTVYFGEGYYGVEAAARGYFGKPAADLDLHEAALLAALVRAPSHDAPCVAPERARSRRNLVLRLMRDQGRISDAELRAATAASIPDASHKSQGSGVVLASSGTTGLYFQEELRRQLVAQFGNQRVLQGGLRVYSTYDPELQQAAESAITTRIAEIAKRRRAARDLQGSLVSIDAKTGDVLALVGGRDFAASSFNRATQARRQAGSTFKPILYAAAIERGYGPGTLLTGLDAPISAAEGAWLPGGEHEQAEYTLRRALKVSSNRAAAQLLQQVGAGPTIYYAQRLGIESPLPAVPSLALGTGDVTLLELTAAYTAFANRGVSSLPRLFTRVDDSNGVTLFENAERHAQAISEATAFMMSSMLADVVSSGTATGVRAAGFRLPAAGKTGTTDDYADAWFVGYTPSIVTGVWFGLDTPAPIMARGFGGTVAVPAWAKFMRVATEGAKAEWYDMPAGVEKVTMCRLSGRRATESCRYHYIPAPAIERAAGVIPASYAVAQPLPPAQPPVYQDIFARGSVPSDTCDSSFERWTDPAGGALTAQSSTPLVDAALHRGTAVERVVGPDGVTRLVTKRTPERQIP